MKILRLNSENVKRIHVVEIVPGDGPLVTIGGLNGAGKSSVLDSVAYALGGQALVPSEPIRKGEESAKIEVDLGDLIVTRRFTKKDGVTTSTLVVKTRDGATYPSPQAILDKLLGKLTFDPLAFSRAESKAQRETLARLVGIDTSLLEAKRKTAFDRRTELNRSRKAVEAQLTAAPYFKDAPAEEVSIANITLQLEEAEKLSSAYNDEHEKYADLTLARINAERNLNKTRADIEDLEEDLEKIKKSLHQLKKDREEEEDILRAATKSLEAQQLVADAAQEKIPDTSNLRDEITKAEQTNRQVRANQKRGELQTRAAELLTQVEAETVSIETAEVEKTRVLVEATYPVPGLGLSDDGVTFNENPFEQASTSEQLKVSIAIGLAMNPTLKVLLIRNGNALDDNSFAQVAEQAQAADAQVWVEYVTGDPSEANVMIVDGGVAPK